MSEEDLRELARWLIDLFYASIALQIAGVVLLLVIIIMAASG